MDDKRNTVDKYRELESDDLSVDEQPLYPEKQVSMSPVIPESSWDHYRWPIISLAVLAAVLLAVDIGLGVYYSNLNGGPRTIVDINRELFNLQVAYMTAVQEGAEAKTRLGGQLAQEQFTKWELEHQSKTTKDYQMKLNAIQMELSVLNSHMPILKEGCRQCLPGWTLIHSTCYYLAFSEALLSRSWLDAQKFCKRQGGDLVIVDSRDKQLALTELVNRFHEPGKPIIHSGFWIGLRDVDIEGLWRWVDGRSLTEGFWNDGEPNNLHNEDCAAIYPRINPFKGWNDAPCVFALRWICEMQPRTAV